MKKSITWLKGLAMVLIVISHMYTVSGFDAAYKFCDDLGRFGVVFFITISGIAVSAKYQGVPNTFAPTPITDVRVVSILL